jgi:3-methylcrotonyl-CoA carboxylase alpha subunit
MPGKIVQVLVKPGDTVKRGQPLAVLEAMKMEHTLFAPSDAKVASVDVAPGDQVTDGATVVRFEMEKAARLS